MFLASLSIILFLIIVFRFELFRRDMVIEKNIMPENAEFTISAMPFRVERIVYYVTVPNATLGTDGNLLKKLQVDYVRKEIFDSEPIAIQVYYEDGNERRIVAELLSHRFDVPYLDSLYGEELLSRKQYEYLRLYKYAHASTRDFLIREVAEKLRPQGISY